MSRKLLYLCFFLSGVAGLIYEIVWSKYLSLFLGSTGIANILLLSTYMGGLALGSAILGRKADTARNPLLGYVILEFAIGLYGGFYPYLYNPVRSTFLSLAQTLDISSKVLIFYKFLACIVSLLIPTFLMGGTLPFLARKLISRLNSMEKKVANLYFLNSLGAVLGTFLSGFYLIANYGLAATLSVAAILNVTAALIAFWISKRQETSPVTISETEPNLSDDDFNKKLYPESIQKWTLIVITISGFIAMVYEVAWIRILTLILGSSTYSFSLMLLTFILGISIGSFLLSRFKEFVNYYLILGICEIGIGLFVLLLMPVIWRLPYFFNHLSTALIRTKYTFGFYQFLQFFICFLVMFIPTILMGMTLPAASKVASNQISLLGKKLGDVYAFNTVGNVLGAIFAGFLFLPLLGLQRTLELSFLANFLIGFSILLSTQYRLTDNLRPAISVSQRKWGTIIGCLILIIAYILFIPHWDYKVMSAGTYRVKGRFDSYKQYTDILASRIIKFYRDGIEASVAIIDMPGPPFERGLVINGKVDATSAGDYSTEAGLGHIPMMIKGNAKRVLVIGFGSGITAGIVSQYPDVEQIDLVEISGDVIDAGKLFANYNHDVLNNPKVHTYIEDAKTFLQITKNKYDVIISEPTNPWIAGIAGLFSKEYFEEVKNHLNPGGLFLQWFHGYEMDNASAIIILHTFEESFNYYSLWNPAKFDFAIVGSPQPYQPNFSKMEQLIENPNLNGELRKLGITNLPAFLYLQIFNKSETKSKRMNFGPVNSDFFPFLEYDSPIGFYLGQQADILSNLDQRNSASPQSLWFQNYHPSQPISSSDYFIFYRQLLADGNSKEILQNWIQSWVQDHPQDPEAILASIQNSKLGLMYQKTEIETRLFPIAQNVDVWKYYVDILSKIYYSESHQSLETKKKQSLQLEKSLNKLIQMDPENSPKYYYELGEISFSLKENPLAKERFLTALSFIKKQNSSPDYLPTLYKGLCRIAIHEQDKEHAIEYLTEFVTLKGETEEAVLLENEVSSL